MATSSCRHHRWPQRPLLVPPPATDMLGFAADVGGSGASWEWAARLPRGTLSEWRQRPALGPLGVASDAGNDRRRYRPQSVTASRWMHKSSRFWWESRLAILFFVFGALPFRVQTIWVGAGGDWLAYLMRNQHVLAPARAAPGSWGLLEARPPDEAGDPCC